MVPYGPVGNNRTGFDALLAAYTFIGVDHPDVAVLFTDVACTCGTVYNTHGFGTLPALVYRDVQRVLLKYISVNLNPGKGEVYLTFMYQGACYHASVASGAIHTVTDQILRSKIRLKYVCACSPLLKKNGR